jgi:hypothetical protein
LVRGQIGEALSCVLLGFAICLQGKKIHTYIYIYTYVYIQYYRNTPNHAIPHHTLSPHVGGRVGHVEVGGFFGGWGY